MNEKRNIYILCGGSSRRMGRDKAGLQIDGETLLQRIIRKTNPHFEETVLLTGSNTYQNDCRQITDLYPESGPLGGLYSALRDSRQDNEWTAIVPVDLPLISSATLLYLSEINPNTRVKAHIARSEEHIQPLCGIYHSSVQVKLEAWLKSGNRQVMKFLDRLDHSFFDISQQEILNVNTTTDYKRIKEG